MINKTSFYLLYSLFLDLEPFSAYAGKGSKTFFIRTFYLTGAVFIGADTPFTTEIFRDEGGDINDETQSNSL